MNKVDLIIKHGKVFTNGHLTKGAIAIKDGVIVAIGEENHLPEAERVIDARGHLILPGGIDPHVHFRDPGRPDRETFKTGTMAAAAGGVTTVLEHPISSPPQYSPEILANRVRVAEPQAVVDFAFFGAAGAEFPEEIAKIAKEGIVAYKTFLHEAPEGREAEFVGLTMADDGEMLDGFRAVAATGLICATHAENNAIISRKINELKAQGRTDFIAHAESRPPISEIETVGKLLHFVRETGVKIDFCHISTPEAMELVKQAKYEGYEVYLETCPHYLFLDEEKIRELGPFAKCNPPLRSKESSDKLWSYINDGSVDFIGSDHGPFLLSEKEKGLENIFAAPAGFPGIDLRLPLMYNAVTEGKLTLKRMVELISENPAKVFGLYPKKGVLNVGSDADLVIIDPNKTFVVSKDKNYSKSKDIAMVYEGMELKGRPLFTLVRGRVVMADGVVNENAEGWGQLVKPSVIEPKEIIAEVSVC